MARASVTVCDRSAVTSAHGLAKPTRILKKEGRIIWNHPSEIVGDNKKGIGCGSRAESPDQEPNTTKAKRGSTDDASAEFPVYAQSPARKLPTASLVRRARR